MRKEKHTHCGTNIVVQESIHQVGMCGHINPHTHSRLPALFSVGAEKLAPSPVALAPRLVAFYLQLSLDYGEA